jgi:DNA-binding PadR family transcriptional regulator
MAVKHVVLGVLAERPQHGYRVHEHLRRAYGGAPALEPSRVYAVLADLERDGLVAGRTMQSASGRMRRVCEITAAGRAALSAWLARHDACRVFLQRPLLLKVALAAYLGQVLDARLLRAERVARERRRRLLRDAVDARTTAPDVLAERRALAHLEVELWLLDRLANEVEKKISPRREGSGSR